MSYLDGLEKEISTIIVAMMLIIFDLLIAVIYFASGTEISGLIVTLFVIIMNLLIIILKLNNS